MHETGNYQFSGGSKQKIESWLYELRPWLVLRPPCLLLIKQSTPCWGRTWWKSNALWVRYAHTHTNIRYQFKLASFLFLAFIVFTPRGKNTDLFLFLYHGEFYKLLQKIRKKMKNKHDSKQREMMTAKVETVESTWFVNSPVKPDKPGWQLAQKDSRKKCLTMLPRPYWCGIQSTKINNTLNMQAITTQPSAKWKR